MPSPEGKRGGWAVECLRKVNKGTFLGALTVAGVSVVAAPVLVVPALTFAAIDGVQLYAIGKWQEGGGKAHETKSDSSKIRLFPSMPHFLSLSKKAA